ncbi:MAG TPA: multicopper oxidase domain-containing protein [Opitutaceae bacterium]
MILRRILLGLAAAMLGLAPSLRAQDADASAIKPTATPEGGDTGGTIFGKAPDPAKTRHYYIAAESVLWDFAPSGREELCGGPLPVPVASNRRTGKLRYVQYTDATFTARVLPTASLGILGPVLRGVVGEYLVVTFLNRTDQPLSMHPHGVKYDKHSEGVYHLPFNGRGSAVAPEGRYTYVWQLDEQSGPMPGEPSSKAWLYHSHVSGDEETNLGLIGAIVVTDPQRARPDGTPRDVDREFATLFMIFDESGLGQAAIEAAEYAGLPGIASEKILSWSELQQQLEIGSRASMNGLVYGNLRGLEMNEGERVRWYLFALGSERDFHTAHWHGLRVVEEGRRRTDVIELLPASMKVADVVADNPGSWLFHCHVADHMREGMFTTVTVHPRDAVGVPRVPESSFLGYGAARSLRLDRAEFRANRPANPARDEVLIEGAVTVFEGFAVYNESVRIRVGNRTAVVKGTQNNAPGETGVRFRATNANDVGVIRGGVLNFELVLQGADWLLEIEPSGSAEKTLKLELEIARGKHVATQALAR